MTEGDVEPEARCTAYGHRSSGVAWGLLLKHCGAVKSHRNGRQTERGFAGILDDNDALATLVA